MFSLLCQEVFNAIALEQVPQPLDEPNRNVPSSTWMINNFARRGIGLFLMLALVVMPVRIAFADNNHSASPAHGIASQPTDAVPLGSPLAMPDMSSNHTHCDTPATTACDKSHASNTTHHCSSDAHCYVALVESFYDATHVAPYTPRSILPITLTSIIIPTATKPPRHSFSA